MRRSCDTILLYPCGASWHLEERARMPKKPHIFLRAQVSICHQWAWSARFHPTVYFAFDFFNPSYLDQILDSCNRNNNLNILSLVRNIKKVLLMFGEAGPVGSAREMNKKRPVPNPWVNDMVHDCGPKAWSGELYAHLERAAKGFNHLHYEWANTHTFCCLRV